MGSRALLQSAYTGRADACTVLSREVRNRRFCRQEKAGDGSRSLQDSANQLNRINDTHGDHVAALRRLGILTEIVGATFVDPADLFRNVLQQMNTCANMHACSNQYDGDLVEGLHYVDMLQARADLCRAVIRSAGELVLKGFNDAAERSVSMKGPQDFLTVTDAASEAHIRAVIEKHFPQDTFFGEEGGGEIGARVWVVDPVDGTANFARGIPHFCISIAYVENGRTEIGAIYNPALDELYFARRGEGATLNGKPITVAGTQRFDAASIEMGWSTRVANETYLGVVKNLLDMGTNVRRAGSGALALAYVADGRSDGYIELHMNSWDCLAGLLLVSEAGGDVCPFFEIGSLREGGAVLAAARGVAAGVSKASAIPLAVVATTGERKASSVA